MRKAILVLLVGLFWWNVGFAKGPLSIATNTSEYIILYDAKKWIKKLIKYSGDKEILPQAAKEHCSSHDKYTYLIGEPSTEFIDHYETFGLPYKFRIRFFCAKSHMEATKVFRSLLDQKKFNGVKFKSWLLYWGTRGVDLYSDDLIRMSNEPNYREKIAEDKKKAEEAEKKKAEAAKLSQEKKKQVKITSMVDDAKSACKDIGHEEGTDRFEDCSLDLYKQSVALAAEKNQQIIYTGSSSLGSSSVTIYDPVRDANRAIDRGMKILTGQCGVSGLEC